MPGLCAQESACTVRGNWQTINQIVLDALSQSHARTDDEADPAKGAVGR